MANREMLMLAKNWNWEDDLTDWYLSEKLDGMRAFWDGGITRGMRKEHVPWANTDKDERYRDSQISTGLWTRYGNIIHAPNFWLDALPKNILLDGELYAGRACRQSLMRAVKPIVPNSRAWSWVEFHVFGSPKPERFAENGKINNPNYSKYMDAYAIMRILHGAQYLEANNIGELYKKISEHCQGPMVAVKQTLITKDLNIREELDQICNVGGEGLIIRHPICLWTPNRTGMLLKIKKLDDMEGTVVGYTAGQGKLLGLFGALILKLDNGKTLELSGFTDAERTIDTDEGSDWCKKNPGEKCPEWITTKYFPIGSRVTFRYRGFTDDGIPQEARYWRFSKEENL